MDLKERVKMFMDDTGAKLSVFSKKVQISDTYYYAWMHDRIEPSDEMCGRIQAYLDEVYKKWSLKCSKIIKQKQPVNPVNTYKNQLNLISFKAAHNQAAQIKLKKTE